MCNHFRRKAAVIDESRKGAAPRRCIRIFLYKLPLNCVAERAAAQVSVASPTAPPCGDVIGDIDTYEQRRPEMTTGVDAHAMNGANDATTYTGITAGEQIPPSLISAGAP
eukprot:6209025-Pleurochrysis_carterae.AAC.1